MTRSLILPCVLILSLLPCISQAEGRRLSVLLLGNRPGMHPGHDSYARYQELFQALGPRGIDITFTDDPDFALNSATLAHYDAFALYANWETITPEQEKALFDYVESGRGFVPIHSASYCFLNSRRCTDLIGGRFKRHGVGDFDTTVVKSDHPITQGLKPFRTWDETYVHEMHNPDKLVLQRRVDAAKGEDEPWTWVREQGKGRVFYTAYGHNEKTWQQAGFHELIFRGILWAVGDAAATEFRKLRIKPLEYVEGAKVPNYERRNPPPQLQKPLSPEESKAHIFVPGNMKLDLFASEKDGLWNVIEFKFDELGRMWTCESQDYPNELKKQGEGRDRIRVFEDNDGDGKAERITVFAEGLSIPSSLVFANDGIIVINIPDTTFLKDTDGDGKADEKKVLFTGWGVGDTHASASNLVYGFDGWIYGCVGYSGFNGTVGGESLRFSSGTFRFKQDGSKLEFLGSTSNNTWGFAFNENGDIFGSTANNQSSFYCAIPRRYYDGVPGLEQEVLPGVDANKKCAIMREYVRQVDVFGGFTAAACHNFYTARTFPKEYWNTVAFIAEPTCHLLYQGIAKPQGTHFRVENGFNLMASDDEWFAPVYADVGPDGSVYVSDFYSFLIQHNPTPNPDRGGFQAENGLGNAFVSDLRDTAHARLWKISPKATSPGRTFKLSKNDPSTLLEALQSDNLLWRRHAQRLLIERGEKDVVPKLQEIAANPKVDAVGIAGGAFGALWTLHGLGAVDLPTAAKALKHPAQGVRRAAAQVLPRSAEGLQALLDAALLKDPEPLVRLTALLVLSEMPSNPEIGTQLLTLSKDAALLSDRWLPTALTIACAKHAQGYLTAAIADSTADTSSAPAEKPENLFLNPGIEETDGNGAKNWHVVNYSGKAEHTISHQGRNGGKCLQITSKDGSDSSWTQEFKLQPHTDYLITGWIKTENLETRRGGKGAMIEIHQLNGKQPFAPPLKGTQDWTQVSLAFNTGRQTDVVINMLYGGWGHATGTAWWDDLSLVKVGQTNQGDARIRQVANAFAKNGTAEAKAAVQATASAKKCRASELILQSLGGTGAVAEAETLDELRKTHQIIRIIAVREQLRFDKKEFTAKAGKPIAIVLANEDTQPHNTIISKPGTTDKLGVEIDKMITHPEGMAKSYIPESADIIAAGKLAMKEGDTIITKVPALEPGEYPIICTFPSHWRLMQSVLKVEQ